MAESELKADLIREKDKVSYLTECCKKYLQAYEQSKKEVEYLHGENERLVTRLNDLKEISMAKEANYEMITHLEGLDQQYFQETIEKLQFDIGILKEENKLLNELHGSQEGDSKNQILSLVKKRQHELVMLNQQLTSQNEFFSKELQKANGELGDCQSRYQELLSKQLEMAKVLVSKDEEIKFWKCSLVELICAEVLKNFTKEAEFTSLLNSSFDFPEKYLRIKEKLGKAMRVKIPQVLTSEVLISNNSFIIACGDIANFLQALTEEMFERRSEVELIVFADLTEKKSLKSRSFEDLLSKYKRATSSGKEIFFYVRSELDLCVYDVRSSENILKKVLEIVYSPESLSPHVRQGLLASESIYILLE